MAMRRHASNFVSLFAWALLGSACGDSGSAALPAASGGSASGVGVADATGGAGATGSAGACPAGQSTCGAGCVDLGTDPANCGQCGQVCAAGQSCVSGTCACAAGTMDCGSGCTDVTQNVANCGSCGITCSSGQLCTGGACVCQQGLTDCSGVCRNLMSDGSNCGACGVACTNGQMCSAGACSPGCTQPGQVACGASCVDLNTDPLNCGNCGIACTGGQVCTGGLCTCPAAGQQLCGGSCVDTQSNASNCGACGVVCPSGQACSSGVCSAGTGGAGNSGGAGNTGGATTGGVATGGGAHTGGAATGGTTSTGGAVTGGDTSTGGAATGGNTNTGGAATGGASTGGNSSGFDPRNPSYILGADVSFIQEQEDQGTRFSDNGTQGDIFAILKAHGFNYIRLRLFHTPGNPLGYQHEFVERAEPYCDTAHTLEVAQRVKAAGMGLSLDFHYSDTWADPDDQNKPLAWEGMNLSQLVTAVHDYTLDTLQTFQGAGVLPDMVQVGNEITPGMLWPEGDSSNFGNLAQLLTAGVQAINEVDSGILKVMHIESPHLPDTVSWWMNAAVDNGVEFDILGISCYSAWHGPPSTWESTFQRLASEQPNLRFMIAEYADNYRAANDIMFDLPRGIGTLFWEPTADGEWGTGLFDSNGNSRDTLSLYDQMAVDYGLR